MNIPLQKKGRLRALLELLTLPYGLIDFTSRREELTFRFDQLVYRDFV